MSVPWSVLDTSENSFQEDRRDKGDKALRGLVFRTGQIRGSAIDVSESRVP